MDVGPADRAFAGYHCIVPDLPEHGYSIMESRLSIEDCARRITLLLEEFFRAGALVKQTVFSPLSVRIPQ